MIITDPNLSPSKRLIEVLKPYFFNDGYTIVKSFNRFSKGDKIRRQDFQITFTKYGSLVHASFAWSVSWPELTKKYQHDLNKKISISLGVSLINYDLSKGHETSWPLDNEETHEYDDFSMNAAADKIISSFQQYVAPFFNTFETLEKVEYEINTAPLGYRGLIWWDNRILVGLLLAKMFRANELPAVAALYTDYISHSKLTAKEELLMLIEQTTKSLT